MVERSKAYLSIMRGTEEMTSVLITESSRVVYKLMQEHYVQLDFTLDEPVYFHIGDYIEDDIFGKFVITQEQMPSYNSSNGGYDYKLKFEAWYRIWKNKTFMLTTSLISDGIIVRKETVWHLTNNLKEHLLAFMRNLVVLDYIEKPEPYNEEELFNAHFDIQDSLETRMESKTMSYSCVDLLPSLTNLANEYECEWWVTGTENDFVIHFGKCETTAEPLDFSLETNVESMNISKNASDFANKIFAFGSTDNLPTSYRKELILKFITKGGVNYSTKDITPDMFVSNSESGEFELAEGKDFQTDTGRYTPEENSYVRTVSYVKPNALVIEQSGDYHVTGTLRLGAVALYTNAESLGSILVRSFGIVYIKQGATVRGSFDIRNARQGSTVIDYGQPYYYVSEIEDDVDEMLSIGAGTYDIEIHVTVRVEVQPETGLWFNSYIGTDPQGVGMGYVDINVQGAKGYHGETAEGVVDVLAYKDGDVDSPLWVRVNPSAVQLKQKNYRCDFYHCVNGGVGMKIEGDELAEIVNGTTPIVVDDNYIGIVPSSYFTSAYDNPMSLLTLGDRRLQLPQNTDIEDSTFYDDAENPKWICLNGYVLPYAFRHNTDSKELVERGITFDGIYPDGKLQVTAVITEGKKDIQDYQGEEENNTWLWNQYHVQLALADGNPFNFSNYYRLDDQELKLRFLTPNDVKRQAEDGTLVQPINPNGCKLAGMTFQTEYAQSINYESETHLQDYVLIRNKDFGAQLPNDILCPTVGDPAVLIGWNVRVMARLGLIADAEKRLMKKTFEYAQAIEESQFTFDCNMMSDFPFSFDSEVPLYESNDKALADVNDLILYAKNDFDIYRLPLEGQKVVIYHNALKNGSKTSRIIGYEFKLDKPYDTPKYTVGETDAYSRLKKIEKEITKLS